MSEQVGIHLEKTEVENEPPELSKHSRMQINDTKAGMENIDKEKINSIIKKHSQKSKFYQKQQLKENELKLKGDLKLKHYQSLSTFEIESAQEKADAFIKEAESSRDFSRTLVHIDMDAFYANVEIRDNPSLGDKPMAVGGESMLSTSNYIARKYGVRAAMPGFIARELCPDLIIVPGNHDKYRKESVKVMKVVAEYDPNYSAASLDEAYADITEYLKNRSSLDISKRTYPKIYSDNPLDGSDQITFGLTAEDCVQELRHRIYLATNLTASAGISSNLRLAKLCSDINKPNGQFCLGNDIQRLNEFIENLPIRKVNGIGPSTALLLDCYGIKTCKDLIEKRALIYLLETQNTFEFLIYACKGLGRNVIEHEGERKSLGHETTFSMKLSNNKEEFLKTLKILSSTISNELLEENLMAQKVHIKIKTTTFEVYTRTKSLKSYTNDVCQIYEASKYLLVNEYNNSKGKLRLRLIGVRVSSLKDIADVENDAAQDRTIIKKDQIENFFKKKSISPNKKAVLSEESDNFDSDFEFLNLESISSLCPQCDELIEGNYEFFYQHVDDCMSLTLVETKEEHPTV